MEQTEGTAESAKYTKERVRSWLLDYAWLGSKEEQAAEIECILSQDGWRYLDARVEQARNQGWSGEQMELAERNALVNLYECHTGPHIGTCPANRRSGTHV